MLADGLRAHASIGDQDRGWAAPASDRLDTLSLDHAQRVAADEVDRLVGELEPTLNAYQRRLLHQIRLAAESLGAVRVATLVRGGR